VSRFLTSIKLFFTCALAANRTVIGRWLLAAGCWLLAAGCWLLAAGYPASALWHWIPWDCFTDAMHKRAPVV
jgi:hypothetical protein